MSPRLRSVLSICCVALAGFFAFRGLEVTGDIEAFVPHADDGVSTQAAQSLATSDLVRTVVVTIRDTSQTSAAALAKQFATALALHNGTLFRRVEAGPEPEVEKRLYGVYFPRRYAFVAKDRNEVLALDAAWVDRRIASLRNQLASPLGTMLSRVAASDPWLAFPALLSDLRSNGGSALDVVDGSFVVSGKPTSVVLVTGRASPFDAEAATAVTRVLEAARSRVLAQSKQAHVDIASVYAFSRAARDEIQRDIGRISTLSTVAIILLFWALFRSVRSLLLGALTLGAGVVAGACACRLVFGSVHGITLAFGSSLLGVGIDFVAHYVNHCALEKGRSADAIMRDLWPGLLLGGTTTALGFLAFAWSSFAGMQELALFSFASIAASLLATRYWAPHWVAIGKEPSGLHRRLVAVLSGWVRLSSRAITQWTLLSLVIVVCALGLPRLRIIDDVRVFNHANPRMIAETDRARAAVGFGDSGRFVLVTGSTEEQALGRNDRVFAALDRAKADGIVTAFRSAFYLLRATETQRQVQSALAARADLATRTKQALSEQGFAVERFVGAELAEARNFDPVTYSLLVEQGLDGLVAPFRTELRSQNGECAAGCIGYLSYVQGVHDQKRLRALIASVEGAVYFDQLSYLERAYGTLRRRTFELVCLGLLAVIALCALKYRSLRAGIAVITPALLSSILAIAVMGLIGAPVTLFHFAAALLVLSMGEDYAVFLLEAGNDPRATTIASVSIVIACVTTVVSFGLLALSAHPALSSLGLVASLGVSFSLILAPTAMLIAGKNRAVSPASD